jgi:hypothetical protein
MREYKFRGKRIDNGEWVYGYVYKDALIGCNILQTKPCLATIMVDPSTAGQYTGLKDKNGREIYEGDILEEEPGYYFEVIWSVECAKFKLQWRTKAIQYPEWNRGVNMTVIGNRWDNPELLKEGSV